MSKDKVQKLITPGKPSDCQPSGFFNTTFDLRMREAFSVEDLENPRFWQLVSGKLNPGDEVRILSEDLTTRALVIVTFKVGTDVKVEVMQYNKFDVDQSDYDQERDDYKVCHQGNGKWGVKKLDTGEYVVQGLTKSKAVIALEDHLRALAS